MPQGLVQVAGLPAHRARRVTSVVVRGPCRGDTAPVQAQEPGGVDIGAVNRQGDRRVGAQRRAAPGDEQRQELVDTVGGKGRRPGRDGEVILAVLVVHVVLAKPTWRDPSRRPDTAVRGKKRMWRFACSVNTTGSMAYWLFGRRSIASA